MMVFAMPATVHLEKLSTRQRKARVLIPLLSTYREPGPHLIAPWMALPSLTDPVTIDGTTNPTLQVIP